MKKIVNVMELDKLSEKLGLKNSAYCDIASKRCQSDLIIKYDFYSIQINNQFVIVKCKKNTKEMITFYKNTDYYSRIKNELELTLKKSGIITNFYN